MAMPPYIVFCHAVKCPNPAAFKIAARWSDGVTDELKTYYLACPECLAKLYASAVSKRSACRLAPGETLDAPGIFDLNRGERDKSLKRRKDLEDSFMESKTK
ncbi:MAG TPA: hypothetical protein VG097_00580 [Gemmata sp.]|jgi:hypothetical protein|nr:hypothetical protein [Gemmata sp.]